MSKRKPTSSQPGIDWYFCKSQRTESLVDEGEKTAGDGDRQTQAIPTTSNPAACVDGLFFYFFSLLWLALILYKTFTLVGYCPFGGVLTPLLRFIKELKFKENKDFQ